MDAHHRKRNSNNRATVSAYNKKAGSSITIERLLVPTNFFASEAIVLKLRFKPNIVWIVRIGAYRTSGPSSAPHLHIYFTDGNEALLITSINAMLVSMFTDPDRFAITTSDGDRVPTRVNVEMTEIKHFEGIFKDTFLKLFEAQLFSID